MTSSAKALAVLWSIVRRVLGAILVVLGAVTVVFLIGELSGQSPALAALGVYADQDAREAFAAANGLNDPLIVRWARYLAQLAHGDFGVSLATGRPIGDDLAAALPVTASLALTATILAVVVSVLLGTAAALKRGGWLDRVVLVVTSLGQSIPAFWLGIMVIQLFAVGLRVIPVGGFVPLSAGFGPWLGSIIAPAVVLAIPFTADLTRVLRTSIVDELGKDYVRTATGLGLRPLTILVRNVTRNAISAPVTVLGLKLGTLFAGAVLVEAVFRLPGIGSLMVRAVGQADYGVVQAAAIVAAVAFVLANALVDIAQFAINPRLARAAR